MLQMRNHVVELNAHDKAIVTPLMQRNIEDSVHQGARKQQQRANKVFIEANYRKTPRGKSRSKAASLRSHRASFFFHHEILYDTFHPLAVDYAYFSDWKWPTASCAGG